MLENKLLRLQQRLANGTSADTEAYLQAKTELQHYHLSELDALTTRTQTRYTEEGEKSTRYFYSLERRQQTKHTISMLTKDNLDTITEPHDILLETHRFYKHLYTPEPIDQHYQDQFLDIPTPSLSPPFRDICEGLVTENELHIALQAMENNKSPGFDGLTTNFYKHFWPMFGTEVTSVLNSAYDQELLAPTHFSHFQKRRSLETRQLETDYSTEYRL